MQALSGDRGQQATPTPRRGQHQPNPAATASVNRLSPQGVQQQESDRYEQPTADSTSRRTHPEVILPVFRGQNPTVRTPPSDPLGPIPHPDFARSLTISESPFDYHRQIHGDYATPHIKRRLPPQIHVSTTRKCTANHPQNGPAITTLKCTATPPKCTGRSIRTCTASTTPANHRAFPSGIRQYQPQSTASFHIENPTATSTTSMHGAVQPDIQCIPPYITGLTTRGKHEPRLRSATASFPTNRSTGRNGHLRHGESAVARLLKSCTHPSEGWPPRALGAAIPLSVRGHTREGPQQEGLRTSPHSCQLV